MEFIRIESANDQEDLKDRSIEIETQYKNMKREV